MSVTILVGTQWGDEGKGKVTDWLAADIDIIARYNGGDNAGHTLNVAGETYKLHFIPSGIVREGVISVMGGGMVIHPVRLLAEMDTLIGQGLDLSPERLKIATNAHMITPMHQALEKAKEAARGSGKIGTTGRGIGPAYTSKFARSGVRASAMRDPQAFGEAIRKAIQVGNQTLTQVYNLEPVPEDDFVQAYVAAAERLKPYLVDAWSYLMHALKDGKNILAEGGQATLLDIDHGNYPFVTSSNPSAGGALVGLGIGPRHVDRVVGVAKAFCSRVGSGPFPTEQDNDIGALLRGDGTKAWDEYGTTTGRPRRCGWLDAVALRYSSAVNSLDEIALMKLDVLGVFDEIQVAVAYEINGQRVEDFPVHQADFLQVTPIYETLPGWKTDIMGVTAWDDLPSAARQFVEWVEKQAETRISLVSVGPGREQTLIRQG